VVTGGEPSFKVKTQERRERGQIVRPRYMGVTGEPSFKVKTQDGENGVKLYTLGCMVVTGEPSFKEKTLAASLFHFQLIQ
jgi:hypothetical protein